MIVDVVGNGPSCYNFTPSGNITVGTNPGIIKSKPDWLMIQDEYTLDCLIAGKLKAVNAPAYLSLHAIHLIYTKWTLQQRKTLSTLIDIKTLSSKELSLIPKPFKFSRKNIITYGRNYKWNLPISCGCMAVMFAIIKHDPSHIRCWGFDAHKDGYVVDLDHHLKRSDGYVKIDVLNLRRNREKKYAHDDSSRDESYVYRGFLWQKTLEEINSYFPNVTVELM